MEKITNQHKVLLKKVLIALGKMPKLCRIWQNDTGTARSLDGKRVIRYGLTGRADITGIICNGRRIELEIKTGKGVQSEKQKNFEKMINEMGGIYAVVRNENEAVEIIKKSASLAVDAL